MADSRFFSPPEPMALGRIAEVAGATLAAGADGGRMFDDVAPLASAGPRQVSFFENRKYLPDLAASRAGAILLSEAMCERAPEGTVMLVTEQPYHAYARVARAFYPQTAVSAEGLAAGCHVAESASLGPGCQVDAGAVIGDGARLGSRCRVRANAVIGDGVEIGDDCDIGACASLSHCLIGNRVILHPGVRIGQDGFGFAMGAVHEKVPQLGRVIIEDDVEIGANSSIDRGAGPDTLIGAGSKIDNLVQIAHNVRIGAGCIVVAQVGISGSTEVGDHAVLAGQVGIIGHLKIGAGVVVAAQSGVSRDIPAGATMGGSPARPMAEWRRSVVALARLARRPRKQGG